MDSLLATGNKNHREDVHYKSNYNLGVYKEIGVLKKS